MEQRRNLRPQTWVGKSNCIPLFSLTLTPSPMPSGWQEIHSLALLVSSPRVVSKFPLSSCGHHLSLHIRCRFPPGARLRAFWAAQRAQEYFWGHVCTAQALPLGSFHHHFPAPPQPCRGLGPKTAAVKASSSALTIPVLYKPFFSPTVTFREILWKPEVQTNITNDRKGSSLQQALLSILQNFYLLRMEEEGKTQQIHTQRITYFATNLLELCVKSEWMYFGTWTICFKLAGSFLLGS